MVILRGMILFDRSEANPLSELDKKKFYTIVGGSKCGTTSTAKYLQSLGYSIEKADGWFDKPKFIESWANKNNQQHIVPLIILRDPIERAWSHFHYMFQNKPYDETDDKIKAERLEKVSRLSCYTRWLGEWLDLGAVVLWYEDLIELPNFPHENKTKVKPELDEDTSAMINNFIMDEYYSFFTEFSPTTKTE